MKKLLLDYSFIIIGSILSSIGIAVFLIPNGIGIGGVTGIALSLNKLFSLRVGLVTIILNIPLFIFGFNLIGKKFAIRTGFAVLISSLLIDWLNSIYSYTQMKDMLLASIFCGTFSGIGVALIFMGGGSTGGMDISAKIIVNKSRRFSLSNIMMFQDFIIYIFVAYSLGINAVMYALVMSFIKTKALDTIQEGISSSKQCIIICENSCKIIEEIQTKLVRGVTILDAMGGFSNKHKKLIYVVIQKSQLNQLRNVVRAIEPSAFVTVSSVSDIVGNYRQNDSL